MNTKMVRPSEISKPVSREQYLGAVANVTPFAEYHNGMMVLIPASQGRHGRVRRWLTEKVRRDVCTPHDVEAFQGVCVDLGDHVFVPDLVLLRRENLGRRDARNGRVTGPPDLVVEVVSSGSGALDRLLKHDVYFRCGVPFYWLFDPFEYTAEEWRASASGYVRTAAASIGQAFSSAAFPGLVLKGDDIFVHEA